MRQNFFFGWSTSISTAAGILFFSSQFVVFFFCFPLFFLKPERICVICSTPVHKTDWQRGAAESLMWHFMIPSRCHPPPLCLCHPDKPRVQHTLTDRSSCSLSHNIIQEHGGNRAGQRADRMFPPPSGFPHKLCSINTTDISDVLFRKCMFCCGVALLRWPVALPHNYSDDRLCVIRQKRMLGGGDNSSSINLDRPLNSLAGVAIDL